MPNAATAPLDERDLAEERLRAYRRELFGATTEARDAGQLGLFNEAEALSTSAEPSQESVPGSKVAAHTRKKPGRKPLDPNLPREVVRHDLPAAERFCAHDGHALVEIGVETSEQLDVIPEQVRVIQHQRVKYACPCCDLGTKSLRRQHASSLGACLPNPLSLGLPPASTSSACPCIARLGCCAASAAISPPTRSPPAWCAWVWPCSP
jgi:hypothetical protein